MKKRHFLISFAIIASLAITVTTGFASTDAISADFNINDLAQPVYVNTTYSGELVDTEDFNPDVDLYSNVTIYYTLDAGEDYSQYTNPAETYDLDNFLRLKGYGSNLDINMNKGPFFEFVRNDSTDLHFKITFNVTYEGITEFYAIYNVFTPCEMYLAREEAVKATGSYHRIITNGAMLLNAFAATSGGTIINDGATQSHEGSLDVYLVVNVTNAQASYVFKVEYIIDDGDAVTKTVDRNTDLETTLSAPATNYYYTVSISLDTVGTTQIQYKGLEDTTSAVELGLTGYHGFNVTITEEPTSTTTPTTTTTTPAGSPGFGIFAGLAAFALATILIRRKRK